MEEPLKKEGCLAFLGSQGEAFLQSITFA